MSTSPLWGSLITAWPDAQTMVKFLRFEDKAGALCYGISHAGGAVTVAEGCPYSGLRDTGKPAAVARHLSPIEPTNVICIGLNYRGHADELKMKYPVNPVVFMKPPFSATGHMAKVVKPRITEKLDYEVEMAVVIGKPCKDVTVEEALEYVLGYTCANDLSTRDWQKVPELSGSQWCRSKGFDGFSPLGPVLVTREVRTAPNPMRAPRCPDSATSRSHLHPEPTLGCLLGTTGDLQPEQPRLAVVGQWAEAARLEHERLHLHGAAVHQLSLRRLHPHAGHRHHDRHARGRRGGHAGAALAAGGRPRGRRD